MNWRLTFLLVLLAVPGVIATSWLALPVLVDPAAVPVPIETLQIATAVQGAICVFLAAICGTALGQKIGLAAPTLSAVVGRGRALQALHRQLLPGLIGGVVGGLIIVAFYAFAPEAIASVQNRASLPLSVRLLYGGITEEVLVRWGLMTVFAWAGWCVFQRKNGEAIAIVIPVAIALSALLFGVAHVPSIASSMSEVSPFVVAYVTAGNALFGVVAGCLFWRYGLEAAIIAHILAHVFAYAIRG